MIEKLLSSLFTGIDPEMLLTPKTLSLPIREYSFSNLVQANILPDLFGQNCKIYTTPEIFNGILNNKKQVQLKFVGQQIVDNCIFVILSDTAQIRVMFRQGDATCFIGADCDGKFEVRLNNSKPRVCIGDSVVSRGIHVAVHGDGIVIGKGCLIGEDVVIQGHDAHGIVDIKEGKLVNAMDVLTVIESRVWLGKRAMILPGNRIGKGSIIGAGAIVTKDIPACSLAVGIPAKVVKQEVTWSRSRYKLDEDCRSFLRTLK